MKLLVTRRLPEQVLEAARRGFEIDVRDDVTPMTEAAAAEALVSYDAILPTLGDGFRGAAFAADRPRCRILANFGVGYNHIDVVAARAAGVEVTNTPGAVTDATADIAMTLILMSARRAGEGERLVRSGAWRGWEPMQMLGQHVTGKTVGIVGMGRIGQAIARRCHFGFGMDVVFFNRSVVEPGFPARQMDDLTGVMETADFVVLALPGGPATRHFIGAAALARMRPEAHLVNISRGDVVDEAALIAALESGKIAGAGLDVYESEPHVPEALRRLDRVTLLPHLGTATLEVRTAMGLMAVANLDAFARGEVPPNRV
jgi:lactate dehydrogenase-like 2-hydroxyacid dehydrogenase